MLLVTGSAGFIGSNFVLDWCAHSNESIIGLDKLTYAGNPENLVSLAGSQQYQLIIGDIGDRTLIAHLMQQYQPRAIIHFAAESHVDRSIYQPAEFIQTNIVGTFNLIDETLNYWRQLSNTEQENFRFLHVSTDEIYGSLELNEPCFSETRPYQPNSPYSASKAASNHLVRAYYHTYNLPTLITNCSNNYGPYQFPEKLIPLIVHRALQNKSLPVYGDGKNIRDWLYVSDHCSALSKVLKHGKIGETYNIGGNTEMTNIAVVHTLCDILDQIQPRIDGRSYREQITFVTDRPGHDQRYAMDTRKIQDELGWQPNETFATALVKTVRWYLDHPAWVTSITSGKHRQGLDHHNQTRVRL